MGRNKDYQGELLVADTPLKDISEESLLKNITYIGFDSYLFKGTVRDNLLMGNFNASNDMLWQVLEQVNFSDFLKSENGLETVLTEKAANLSGGQRQRLALARAILHDSPVYIFDEATSNIDVESENEILTQIYKLSKTKTVIMITHRLANAAGADNIYVMENGFIAENGRHRDLIQREGLYARLWNSQSELESYSKGAAI